MIDANNRWFAHYNIHENAKVNLFCFTFAGSSASFFAPWKNYFNKDINFIPVLYPAREKRISEPMPNKVDSLVNDFISDNKGLFKKPYAIWGHCSGALIGLEVAYREGLNGNWPIGCIISGCEPPIHVKQSLEKRSIVSKTSDQDIIDDLSLYGLIPKTILQDEMFLKYFIPIYRKDLKVFSSYDYLRDTKLQCPALILNGSNDSLVSEKKLNDWVNYFQKEIKYKTFKGSHHFIDEHRREVSETIIKFIECINRRIKIEKKRI
ncbi:TPA: thioesterase II family protein [Enterococcus faecium]|uniref:thioesterase II family protein n=1 Tax=Aerococcus mictus TaxID=2976810 RepID=UPI00227CC4F4|nr:thioesterase domain-containing protein [Aerococcus mictus]MCY3077244.1 thioesterase domain-containing protein [Aerococcus mictus]HBM4377558.1 thioesterase [Enterococcus faecium]HBM4421375.1 thioesterase [Enterococcus faecium]